MITRLYVDIDKLLAGKPDRWITTALIALAAIGVIIALFGPRPLKAAVLAYWVAP